MALDLNTQHKFKPQECPCVLRAMPKALTKQGKLALRHHNKVYPYVKPQAYENHR